MAIFFVDTMDYSWGFNDNNGIIVGLMGILMGILSDIVPMGYGE